MKGDREIRPRKSTDVKFRASGAGRPLWPLRFIIGIFSLFMVAVHLGGHYDDHK